MYVFHSSWRGELSVFLCGTRVTPETYKTIIGNKISELKDELHEKSQAIPYHRLDRFELCALYRTILRLQELQDQPFPHSEQDKDSELCDKEDDELLEAMRPIVANSSDKLYLKTLFASMFGNCNTVSSIRGFLQLFSTKLDMRHVAVRDADFDCQLTMLWRMIYRGVIQNDNDEAFREWTDLLLEIRDTYGQDFNLVIDHEFNIYHMFDWSRGQYTEQSRLFSWLLDNGLTHEPFDVGRITSRDIRYFLKKSGESLRLALINSIRGRDITTPVSEDEHQEFLTRYVRDEA